MNLTEDTKVDCADAWETLKNWALVNGITPAGSLKANVTKKTELTYIYPDKEYVI